MQLLWCWTGDNVGNWIAFSVHAQSEASIPFGLPERGPIGWVKPRQSSKLEADKIFDSSRQNPGLVRPVAGHIEAQERATRPEPAQAVTSCRSSAGLALTLVTALTDKWGGVGCFAPRLHTSRSSDAAFRPRSYGRLPSLLPVSLHFRLKSPPLPFEIFFPPSSLLLSFLHPFPKRHSTRLPDLRVRHRDTPNVRRRPWGEQANVHRERKARTLHTLTLI